MSRFGYIVLFAAMSASIAPSSMRADEPPDAETPAAIENPAEAVLREAGLTRNSPSFVVQEELAAIVLADEIKQLEAAQATRMSEYQALERRYNSKRAEASRLRDEAIKWTSEYNSETKRYERKETRDESKLSQARSIDDEADRFQREAQPIEREFAASQREIREGFIRHRMLVSRAMNRYAALAARPEIKAALREVNRGTHPKLALGPIAAYRQNVLKQSIDTLGVLGYRRDGDLYWISEDAEFIKRGGQARLLWREVAMHERRLASPGQATPATPIPATTRQLTKPPVPSRPSVPFAPGNGGARPTPAPAVKPLTAAQIAAKRAELVRLVRELRLQADVLQERRDALLAEGEARDALEEINRASRKAHQAKLGTKPGWKLALQDLEAIERAIYTEKVPLTRDGERLKVDVRLNGKPASLVVDPAGGWVKLPDHLAAELGVQPVPDARTVPLGLGDGRTIQARWGRIRTLQVGPFADEGVACLILPPGSGDGPPVLGGLSLNRVVAELDAESATLTLTRVNPPPTAKPDDSAQESKSGGIGAIRSPGDPLVSRPPGRNTPRPRSAP